MPEDGKEDEDEEGEKGGLWQDTQSCACQNKTPRPTRRKFTTKQRGGSPKVTPKPSD